MTDEIKIHIIVSSGTIPDRKGETMIQEIGKEKEEIQGETQEEKPKKNTGLFYGFIGRAEFKTVEEAIDGLGLNWQVGTTSQVMGTMPDGKEIQFFENTGIVRLDTGFPLAVMGSGYKVIQNLEALSLFSEAIEEQGIVIDGGGSFEYGKRVWVACRLPGEIKLSQDTILKYLIISWSHNGERQLTVSFMPYAQNLQISLAGVVPGVQSTFTARHTKNAQEKIKQIAELLKRSHNFYQKFEEMIKELDKKTITFSQIDEMLEFIYPDPEEVKLKKDGTEKKNANREKRDLVRGLFTTDKMFGPNLLNLVMADSVINDHQGRIRKTKGKDEFETRAQAALFGANLVHKKDVLNTALNWETIKQQKVLESRIL